VLLAAIGKHDEPQRFVGNTFDMSLLVSYADHVALTLWDDVDQGKLTLITHKLSKFGAPIPKSRLVNNGLLPLCNISHKTTDKGLISVFAERWHYNTNTLSMR